MFNLLTHVIVVVLLNVLEGLDFCLSEVNFLGVLDAAAPQHSSEEGLGLDFGLVHPVVGHPFVAFSFQVANLS